MSTETAVSQRAPDLQLLLRSTVFAILAEAYSHGDMTESDVVELLLEHRLGSKPKQLAHIGASMANGLGVPTNEIGVVIELCNTNPGLGYSVALALAEHDPAREIASFAFRTSDSEDFVKGVVLSALEKKPGKCVVIRKVLGQKEVEETKAFIKMLQEVSNGMIICAVKSILATVPLSDSNGTKWGAIIHTT